MPRQSSAFPAPRRVDQASPFATICPPPANAPVAHLYPVPCPLHPVPSSPRPLQPAHIPVPPKLEPHLVKRPHLAEPKPRMQPRRRRIRRHVPRHIPMHIFPGQRFEQPHTTAFPPRAPPPPPRNKWSSPPSCRTPPWDATASSPHSPAPRRPLRPPAADIAPSPQTARTTLRVPRPPSAPDRTSPANASPRGCRSPSAAAHPSPAQLESPSPTSPPAGPPTCPLYAIRCPLLYCRSTTTFTNAPSGSSPSIKCTTPPLT